MLSFYLKQIGYFCTGWFLSFILDRDYEGINSTTPIEVTCDDTLTGVGLEISDTPVYDVNVLNITMNFTRFDRISHELKEYTIERHLIFRLKYPSDMDVLVDDSLTTWTRMTTLDVKFVGYGKGTLHLSGFLAAAEILNEKSVSDTSREFYFNKYLKKPLKSRVSSFDKLITIMSVVIKHHFKTRKHVNIGIGIRNGDVPSIVESFVASRLSEI